MPVSCSWVCEDLAAAAGASLLRTTTGLPALMARAQRSDVTFAGNSEGVLIFPDLHAGARRAHDLLQGPRATLDLS